MRFFQFTKWIEHRYFAIGLGVILLSFFLKLSVFLEVRDGAAIVGLDEYLLKLVGDNRQLFLTGAVIDVTALGSKVLLTIFMSLAAGILWLLQDKLSLLHIVIAWVTSGLLTKGLKTFFERERPETTFHLVEVSSSSYPSGHTLAAAVIFMTIASILCRYIKDATSKAWIYAAAFLLILLVGISRIYLGVHYPSDVAAGICFGVGWSIVLTFMIERLTKVRQ